MNKIYKLNKYLIFKGIMFLRICDLKILIMFLIVLYYKYMYL